MIKAGGMDVFFQLLKVGGREFLQGIVLFEQVLCHHIDPGIRALGAHDDSNQKLPGRFMVQVTPVFGSILPVQGF